MVENSLIESYEEEEISDDEAQVLSKLNEPAIVDNCNTIEKLNIMSEFNLKLIVIIDYVDVSHYEKDQIISDNEDQEEFNIEDIVCDILS